MINFISNNRSELAGIFPEMRTPPPTALTLTWSKCDVCVWLHECIGCGCYLIPNIQVIKKRLTQGSRRREFRTIRVCARDNADVVRPSASPRQERTWKVTRVQGAGCRVHVWVKARPGVRLGYNTPFMPVLPYASADGTKSSACGGDSGRRWVGVVAAVAVWWW